MLDVCQDSHPFLPTLVRAFDESHTLLTTPYAVTTLARYPFAEHHFFTIAINVLRALRCIHGAKWLHGDLSSSNVLLVLASSPETSNDGLDLDDDEVVSTPVPEQVIYLS